MGWGSIIIVIVCSLVVGDWLAKYERDRRAGMTSAERLEDWEDSF